MQAFKKKTKTRFYSSMQRTFDRYCLRSTRFSFNDRNKEPCSGCEACNFPNQATITESVTPTPAFTDILIYDATARGETAFFQKTKWQKTRCLSAVKKVLNLKNKILLFGYIRNAIKIESNSKRPVQSKSHLN